MAFATNTGQRSDDYENIAKVTALVTTTYFQEMKENLRGFDALLELASLFSFEETKTPYTFSPITS